jgi:hypothetical protein
VSIEDDFRRVIAQEKLKRDVLDFLGDSAAELLAEEKRYLLRAPIEKILNKATLHRLRTEGVTDEEIRQALTAGVDSETIRGRTKDKG